MATDVLGMVEEVAGAVIPGLAEALPVVIQALQGAGAPDVADQVTQILGQGSALDAAQVAADAAAAKALGTAPTTPTPPSSATLPLPGVKASS